MAKNLRPCNFITKVDGKEKSMSFDQMREYLLANPDVWMPASTRKIGAGKMQASMGGRKVEDNFKETIAERLGQFEERINAKKFPLVLEVAEAVLPKPIFKRYQAFYEMAARNGITVGNIAPPFGNVAAYAYNSVQLHIPTIKKYTPDYEDFAETLNHEIIHGLISYGLWGNEYQVFANLQGVMKNVEGNFDKANDEVKQIINYIQRNRSEYKVEDYTATDEDRYIGDLEELITYAFTNTEFAKFLDSIPASKDIKASGKTIFDQLKDIIRTFIQSLAKTPTALDEVNEVLNKYFDTSFREEDFMEKNEKYGWGYKFEATKERLQASEGGRGEGARGRENNDINEAIVAAGKAYREAGNSKDAAISAGVKFLKDKGLTEKEAYDAVAPLLEAMIATSEEKVMPGSIEDPAGWINIGRIPQDVLDTIDVQRTTMQATLEIGMNAIKNGQVDPRVLTESFANGTSRPLTATETAALVAFKVSLQAQLNQAYTELERANQTTSDQRKIEAQTKVQQLERELENYYITSRKSGYEMGLAFRTRQLLLDADYNIIDLKQKYRALYGAVPTEVTAEWEKLDKEKKELAEREKKLNEDREAFERDKAMAGLVQEVEQKKKGKDTGGSKDSSFIVRNLINNMTKIPSIFSRKAKGQASAGLRAGEQTDGEYIWTQAITIVADFIGKKAKPEKAVVDDAVKNGVDYIKSTKWYKEMSADEQKEAISAFTLYTKQNTKAPGVKVSEENEIKISHDTLRKYTEQVLENNPMDPDDPKRYEKLMKAVSQAILDDMASELPVGTSWEDIRDAITKYGQTSHPSQEDLEVEIRNMKDIGRKMAQLEAVLSGNRPLKSGYQRDPQSPEARRLVEQINEGLKRLAVSEMNSEEFLRTSLDRIKKNLQNQIEDLDLQIKEGKRRDKNKSKVEYDQEAILLKDLRDLLKKELDKIDPKDKKLSAEQQLNNLISGLERSIGEYQRRIVEKDFSVFKKAQAVIEGLPQTEKYKQLLKERDEVRKKYLELKNGPKKTPLEKRMDALQKEYDSLLDGTYTPKQPPVQYNDPRLTDLRDKIKDLKKQMGFIKTPEEAKIERLRKQLSDLLAGNVRNRPAKTPDSPEAAAIRQQIQDLKDRMGLTRLAEINRAEKAKAAQLKKLNQRILELETNGRDIVGKDKIETALIQSINDEIEVRREVLQGLLVEHGIAIKKLLDAEKKRVNKIIEEKEERIATGNYAPKVSTKLKLTKADYDQEMKDIMAKRQAINEKYEEAFYKAKLAERTKWQKGFDLLGGLWNITKSLRSSFDLSAPLRQGLFEVLSQKPTTTAKGLAFMMRAAFQGIANREDVGKAYEEWMAGVKESPEYQIMKDSKLFLADRTGKGKAAEDAFVNNLVKYIPFLERPVFGYSLNLYTRSELAYNAFLNYMRVAAFKEVIDSLGDLDIPITFETNPEEFKGIAEIINISTGRASLGTAESSANAINTAIFSIRLVLSRLLFLFIPFKAPFMTPAQRKYAMTKYARAIASLSAIIGMAVLYYNNDDDDETYVELDPRGKFARINLNENLSVDLTAGLSQWITFLTRVATQQYKTAKTGEIKQLGESSMTENFDELVMGFVSGKMSPSARIFYEYASSVDSPEEPGKRITKYGQEYSLLKSVAQLGVPMIIEEGFSISKAMESPYKTAGLTALTGLGGTVSTKSERYELPSQAAKKVFKEDKAKYDDNQKKIQKALKEGDASTVNKLLDGQVKATAEMEGYVDSDIQTNKFYYLEDVFNRLCADSEDEKSGLTTDKRDSYYIDNREAFFILMSGNNFPPIDESIPEEEQEKIIKVRENFTKKFSQIPEEKRIGVIKNYGRQAKERKKIAETLNKLNVVVDEEKINWEKTRLNGYEDWYFQFEKYKDTPNFKKYLAEDK